MKHLSLSITLYGLLFLLISCEKSAPDKRLIQALAPYTSTSTTQQTEIFYIVSSYDCELCLGHIVDWAEDYARSTVIQTGIFFKSMDADVEIDSTTLVAPNLINWTITHDPSLFELLGASHPDIESPYAIEVFDGELNSIRSIK